MLNKKAFQKRILEVMLKENESPLQWYYCSFADDHKFLGGVIIQAHGIQDASMRTSCAGLNPGGELFAVPLDTEPLPPEKYHNILLTKEQVKEIWPEAKSLGEWKQDDSN